jgi:cell division protein FtsB
MGDQVQLGGREINLKLTILFLVPAVFMLLLMACGGTAASSVDIESTVEAKAAVEGAAEATAETKVLATAKAQLKATNKVLEDNNVALEAEIAELKAVSEALAKDTKYTTAGELDSVRKEELLALADNRSAWFLASDITTEALEGLYGSWSVICRNETSLADYKGAVYEWLRPLVLEGLEMKLQDVQKANRYYNVESWSPPWAYVEQTWKIGDKIVLGPERQLYVLESGAWRYHDC